MECGAWSSLNEELREEENPEKQVYASEKPINLHDLKESKELRFATGINELDRVLGGGVVVGSFLLLGGDPGIGKSTLALQAISGLDKILYASGEESAAQVKLRAERLGLDLKKISFLPQTDIGKIIATAAASQPQLLIIDSIQTIYSQEASGSAGSVSQITACAAKLMELAKSKDIAVLAIGHVTKDGSVAGPKTLEHLVDTVLYLENDSNNAYRILRTVKNRFGSTGEIGIFEMSGSGLKEISDPTQIFVDKELDLDRPGIITTLIMEGSRPFLIEIQALASKTFFGYPQRRANGLDLNRLQMLLAVLMKYSKINLGNHDVYANVAGGLKIKDPASDLGICLAAASALLEKSLGPKILLLGEVGLSGEVRMVPQLERRLKEAEKMGFSNAIIPYSKKIPTLAKLKLTPVKNIGEAINLIK